MDAAAWVEQNWPLIHARLPHDHTPVLGVAGAQGSGKSWLAETLAVQLGPSAVVLSLDDFYLPKCDRTALAQRIHPNLATRGVPGTHDIALFRRTIDALMVGPCRWPKFDKISDDRMPSAHDNHVDSMPTLIIVEGWCIGAPRQSRVDLAAPMNAYERKSDPESVWRSYVNAQLAGPYAAMFAAIDLCLFLKAPAFSCVMQWRIEQEYTTYASRGLTPPPTMPQSIEAFIQPFERITRHMLKARFADIVIDLDAGRQVRKTMVGPAP